MSDMRRRRHDKNKTYVVVVADLRILRDGRRALHDPYGLVVISSEVEQGFAERWISTYS